jgi:hypothetical protein
VTAADIKLMAWARNYMHDEGAVHRDEWEDFYNIRDELANPENWSIKGRRKTINWDAFLQRMVLVIFFLMLINRHAPEVFFCLISLFITAYVYAVTFLV